MPKVKVEHIISFSSEDPVHLASNILSSDSGKKWRCQTTGEKSASIILQLEKASLISGIDIGNEHSAYVEVLVNRCGSTDDFKVLVVMSSFMTPLESRQSTNTNKVRMFSYADLRSPERDEKWDRVKIVCTQPFNRRVQYGLSFVTINSSDSKESVELPASTKIGNFSLRASSPDNLAVGNLFARRKELSEDQPMSAAAAIRGASSSVLQQGSPKLKPKLKEVASTSKISDTSNSESTPSKPRNRNELLYRDDEERPNSKIDQLVDQKNKEKQERQLKESERILKEKQLKQAKTKNKPEQSSIKQQPKASSSNSIQEEDKNKRKLNVINTPQKKVKPNRVTKPFNELLSGVTIVISGIENPERSTIRSEALEMGGKYKGDWDGTCTHLICAFTNTPKFSQVKGKGKIVNRMWISDCHTEHKRLPWRRYALDSKDQNKNESEDEIWEKKEDEMQDKHAISDNDTDTEDEIERIRTTAQTSENSPNLYSVETDEEPVFMQNNNSFPDLPDFFSGLVLYIDKGLSERTSKLLTQYITAYNGFLVDEVSDLVDYIIASPVSSDTLKILCPEAKVIAPDWIWKCHNTKKLVPFDCYSL